MVVKGDIERCAGKKCVNCDGPATHLYGTAYLCCDCHAGKDGGLYNREEAEAIHAEVLKGVVEHEEEKG